MTQSATVPAGHPAPAPTPRRAAHRRWLPPQHGAWAMLLVPYLAGLITTGFAWPDIPLLVAWLGGYLLSYFALLAVKTKRPGRVRAQLLVYGGFTAVATVVVLLARPRVLLFAPAFALVLTFNAVFARRRDDRALANGIASVTAACIVVPLVAVVAREPVGQAGDAFALCLLFFTGSLLFVKTMFRERDSVAMRRASAGFHVAALVAAGALSLAYVPVFVVLLVRAVGLAGRTLRPGRVGIVEIGTSLMLLGTIAATG